MRCRSLAAAAAHRRPGVSVRTLQSEEHAGYEIFYVPALSGWQYRAPDSAPSLLSYRSAFLARKAVDELPLTPDARRSGKPTS
jgi:hypothetical protein